MRRAAAGLLATIAALAPALPAAPAAGAQAGGRVAMTQFAYATNLVHIGRSDYMIIAGAARVTNPAGRTRTTAYAKKSKCATLQKKHFKVIACSTFVWPRRIPDGNFTFDPSLDSAAARWRHDGRRTSLSWRGVHLPSPDGSPGADPGYGAYAQANLYRDARAGGRIVGIPYRTHHFGAFALLVEGGDGEVRSGRGLHIRRTASGALKVRALYRIRLAG